MKHLSIAIVELYEHVEVINFLLRALPTSIQIEALLISRTISKENLLESDRIKRIISQADQEDRVSFLRKNTVFVEKVDMVIVTTQNTNHLLLDIYKQLTTRRVLVVHDSNFHFLRQSILSYKIKDILRRVRWKFNGSWSRRLQQHEGWDGFIVARSSMAEVLRTAGVQIPILAQPFGIWPNSQINQNFCGKLIVVIPGAIDREHRDYSIVIDALKLVSRNVQIILPGRLRRSTDQRVLEDFYFMAKTKCNVEVIFGGDSDYYNSMEKAHALILPFRVNTIYATQFEKNGVTKSMGSEHDQISFGKYALVSSNYNGHEALSELQYRYRNAEELASLIESFNVESTSLKAPFLLTLEGVQSRFWDFFQKVIKQP